MDLYDFIERQNVVANNVGPFTNLDYINKFSRMVYDLNNLDYDNKETPNRELQFQIVENYINVAFMALQAAKQNGASKEDFCRAITNVLLRGV